MLSNKVINKSVNAPNFGNFLKSLILLMKPRVMSLVVFTSAVGLLTSPNTIPLLNAFMSIFFVTLGAGAAGTLNMWYEADLDKLMTRTCLRPIPTGKINKQQALIFGIVLSIISIYGLYYFSNFLSAFLLFVTITFYLFVYTIWLKRKTPQNIVIGGAAGALPPVIGWTIATNILTFESITFFLIIFYWTPSHFWALSLYKADDYEKAKIPMLPITNGIQETKKKIFVYSLFMLPVVILPYVIGFVGETFLIISLSLTIYYNYICYDLFKFKKNEFELNKAKKVFGYSILYLFLIFVLFLIDSLI
jgi:protoheme IX farnesyltransferase